MKDFDDTRVIPALRTAMNMPSFDTAEASYNTAEEIDLEDYDQVVLCMSGGKDSIASLCHLLDQGVDPSKIELWHHDVDGREGSHLMDWPFMADYNRKLAQSFNLPIYFSWLEGGFEGEMCKENAIGRPHHVETPDGVIVLERDAKRAKPATRLRFPQVAADLRTRWCSSALKIDVGRRALNNQERFHDKKVLFITGERREESPNRARYNQLERHACDRRAGRSKRHVDAWRPVLGWDEARVWDALMRHGVVAPVPYRLGWGRSSCRGCIFNSDQIWATIGAHWPSSVEEIAGYEERFETTIARDKRNVAQRARDARPMEIDDFAALAQGDAEIYDLPIRCAVDEWKMPKGAFNRASCGPS